MRFEPGKFVVFEGLDATGKSTQMKKLVEFYATVADHDPEPMFTHQPSGGSELGEAVYRLTEADLEMDPLTRQFLHLAAHSEHAKVWFSHLDNGAVFMDRFWWSTVAYGYFSGKLHERGIRLPDFYKLARMPEPRHPDLIFLFMYPYHDDPHNTPGLVEGYRWLPTAPMRRSEIVFVPEGNADIIHDFIIQHLAAHGVLTQGE